MQQAAYKSFASSYLMIDLTQEALPPKSYAPIGQEGPLSLRPPRPKPFLSLKLGPTHPWHQGGARDLSVHLVLEHEYLHNVWHS